METNHEKERGESWPDFSGLWTITFNFGSIFDKIKKYIEKRKLRAILKSRVKRFNDSKSRNRD